MHQKDRLDQITRRIIGAAIEVHKALGPGLLESAYQACLAFELRQLELVVEEQRAFACGLQERETRLWLSNGSDR
jgi:GxxExxY protein